MTTPDFNRIITAMIDHCTDTLIHKAKEYATDDRLHNFKQAAHLEKITPTQALGGMMAKHTVSVYDMIASGETYPLELWDEKIGDSINYLLLLRAMVEEEASKLPMTKDINSGDSDENTYQWWDDFLNIESPSKTPSTDEAKT